jgi:hypothetical protein
MFSGTEHVTKTLLQTMQRMKKNRRQKRTVEYESFGRRNLGQKTKIKERTNYVYMMTLDQEITANGNDHDI